MKMNLANAFHHILEEFLDDIDNEDAETIADPDCPGCDGTGFSSWEEYHPYGAGLASETLYEVCSCVTDNAAPFVLARMAGRFTVEELGDAITLLVKMKQRMTEV